MELSGMEWEWNRMKFKNFPNGNSIRQILSSFSISISIPFHFHFQILIQLLDIISPFHFHSVSIPFPFHFASISLVAKFPFHFHYIIDLFCSQNPFHFHFLFRYNSTCEKKNLSKIFNKSRNISKLGGFSEFLIEK